MVQCHNIVHVRHERKGKILRIKFTGNNYCCYFFTLSLYLSVLFESTGLANLSAIKPPEKRKCRHKSKVTFMCKEATAILVEQPRAVLFNPQVRKGLTTDSCRTSPTD